ncbi:MULTISPECIES: F0F1 ATP synthase subunit delta [Afifella]|uniref:F0F1 ATP synthase subunit delta n=1 Tax=Afifella TaxID=643217 RepID=UPI000FE39032|nr:MULTISPECIES: F0F1 ATP synthase subunit delta [Afifella]MCF1505197.1 F0F1 ATP synthase subunit delta [Afifella sp. H1R]MCT8268645.1 F0F1 ATP synthase subunit delta [Afifella sp. JA880]
MADSSSPVSGVADRYAAALFELALEESALEQVEADLDRYSQMLDESADFRRLVESPAFSSEDQLGAMKVLNERAGITGLAANFVGVLAQNRRLFTLPGVIRSFKRRAAEHRGEVTAQVTAAQALSEEQKSALKAALKERLGKDANLDLKVDPAILGGLVVKLGSQMIDTSLRTKLNMMKSRLKEAS